MYSFFSLCARSGTTGFKRNSLRASLLTVLHVLYVPLFGLFLYYKRLAKAALNASRVRVASYIPSATALVMKTT